MYFEADNKKEELIWSGKNRSISSKYSFPQLLEEYGQFKDGWINKIFLGDNLNVMNFLLNSLTKKIDLVYIDPPFNSMERYKKKHKIKFNNKTKYSYEEIQFSDIWSNNEYLQFMYERLILIRELLSDTGSIYVHCDWHSSHFLKIICDEIFGSGMFRNEIIWHYSYGASPKKAFKRNTNSILFYTKTDKYVFNKTIVPAINPLRYNKTDENGDRYLTDGHHSSERRFYLKDGILADNVWTFINDKEFRQLNSLSYERKTYNYPTQKPESIAERIIKASTNEGDIVFDCFMGSGTTQAVAMKFGRKFIGVDINKTSIQTATKRLLNVRESSSADSSYTGFQVYNMDETSDFSKVYLQKQNDKEVKSIINKEEGRLIIEEFYPLELIKKFKMNIEDIEDWRELVDSVLIDWCYEGLVMKPTVYDITANKKLVKGLYKIPNEVGVIRIKIIDRMYESYYFEI